MTKTAYGVIGMALAVAGCGSGGHGPTTIGARGGGAVRGPTLVFLDWGERAVFEADCWAPDDAADPSCFQVGLADGTYASLGEAPVAQRAALDLAKASLQTTPTEIKVCVEVAAGDATCTTLKPKVGRGASEPIRAVANAAGTTVVVLLGDATSGKGVAEIWDVAKKKKTASIKYAKGDYKCGDAAILGDTIYVSASVCAGPDARGTLYTLKGKKLADVGGKDFGTFGTSAVQVDETRWAFLEEGAGTVAIQHVDTGALAKTIDLVALWAGDDASDGTRANGNPGESALVRGPTLVFLDWGERAVFEADCWAPDDAGCARVRAEALADGELAVGAARFRLTGTRTEECRARPWA